MAEIMRDHVDRLRALMKREPGILTHDEEADLHAALNELEQLRLEGELATAMREYESKLKRTAFWWATYAIVGIAVWNLCSYALGLADPIPALACFVAGVPVGALRAWIDDRREARHG